MQRIRLCATSVAFWALVLLSCACSTTRKDAHEYVDQGVQAVDRTSRTQIAIAQADPDLDQAALATYAGQFELDAGASAAQLAAVRKRIEEQEGILKEVVLALADGALGAIPGVGSLPALAQAVGAGLKRADRENADGVRDVAEQDNRHEERARERSEIALGRAKAAEEFAKEAERRSEERLRVLGDSLAKDTRERLETFRGDLETLRKSANDPARFDSELDRYLQAAGLAPDQVAEFKRTTNGLSNQEILELLAAVAAGLGSGAAASRLGKSRSAEELAQLKKENESQRRSLNHLNLEIARAVPGVRFSEPQT